MLNGGEKPQAFPLKTGARQRSPLMLLFNIFLEVLDDTDKQKTKCCKYWRRQSLLRNTWKAEKIP